MERGDQRGGGGCPERGSLERDKPGPQREHGTPQFARPTGVGACRGSISQMRKPRPREARLLSKAIAGVRGRGSRLRWARPGLELLAVPHLCVVSAVRWCRPGKSPQRLHTHPHLEVHARVGAMPAEALLFPSGPGSVGPYLLRSYLCVLVGSWSLLWEAQEAQVGSQGCGGWPRGWGLPPRELCPPPSAWLPSTPLPLALLVIRLLPAAWGGAGNERESEDHQKECGGRAGQAGEGRGGSARGPGPKGESSGLGNVAGPELPSSQGKKERS